MMRIGEKIRILREIKGISTKDMSSELGMTQAGYLKIERDEVDINTEKVEKISNKLGVKPHELFMDEKFVYNHQTNSIYGANNNFTFPEDMKKLYEDKIELLVNRIQKMERKLRKMGVPEEDI